MTSELYRVEQTISAVSSGNLDPEGWQHSCVMALGLSGQKNRLGSAVLHLIEHPNLDNYRLTINFLARVIVHDGIANESDSIDVANDALEWYESRHCPKCEGRGVLNFEQAPCTICSGTGDRARPANKQTADTVALIVHSLDWLESQQRVRLK